MLDTWRKQAELFLGLAADVWAVIVAAIVPPEITSKENAAQMRTVRISAILVIVIAGLWLKTTFAGENKVDISTFALLTLVYFTGLSWIVAGARSISDEERKRDDLVATSLSLIIGFVALAMLVVVAVRQFDVFYQLPVGNLTLRIWATIAGVLVAGGVTLYRSFVVPTARLRPLSPLLTILVVSILILSAGAYIYFLA